MSDEQLGKVIRELLVEAGAGLYLPPLVVGTIQICVLEELPKEDGYWLVSEYPLSASAQGFSGVPGGIQNHQSTLPRYLIPIPVLKRFSTTCTRHCPLLLQLTETSEMHKSTNGTPTEKLRQS